MKKEEGPLEGKIPGTDRDLGAVRGRKRGGNHIRDGRHRITQGNPCGSQVREGIAYKRWRPVRGGTVQVDGCSATGRVWGGGAGSG